MSNDSELTEISQNNIKSADNSIGIQATASKVTIIRGNTITSAGNSIGVQLNPNPNLLFLFQLEQKIIELSNHTQTETKNEILNEIRRLKDSYTNSSALKYGLDKIVKLSKKAFDIAISKIIEEIIGKFLEGK